MSGARIASSTEISDKLTEGIITTNCSSHLEKTSSGEGILASSGE